MSDLIPYKFSHAFKPSNYRSETVAAGVKSHLDDLAKVYDDARERAKAIDQSRGLTPTGKRDARRSLAQDLAEKLTQWGGFQRHYASQISRLENESKGTRRTTDPITESRQREVRDALRQLSRLDLDVRVKQALVNGEIEILRALANSLFPLDQSMSRDELSAALYRIEHPTDAEALDDLRRAHDEVQSARKSVESDLRELGVETDSQRVSQVRAA